MSAARRRPHGCPRRPRNRRETEIFGGLAGAASPIRPAAATVISSRERHGQNPPSLTVTCLRLLFRWQPYYGGAVFGLTPHCGRRNFRFKAFNHCMRVARRHVGGRCQLPRLVLGCHHRRGSLDRWSWRRGWRPLGVSAFAIGAVWTGCPHAAQIWRQHQGGQNRDRARHRYHREGSGPALVEALEERTDALAQGHAALRDASIDGCSESGQRRNRDDLAQLASDRVVVAARALRTTCRSPDDVRPPASHAARVRRLRRARAVGLSRAVIHRLRLI